MTDAAGSDVPDPSAHALTETQRNASRPTDARLLQVRPAEPHAGAKARLARVRAAVTLSLAEGRNVFGEAP